MDCKGPRYRIYRRLVLERIDPGQYLPNWAVAIKCLLFPLHALPCYLPSRVKYDILRDVLIIDGIEYSLTLFEAFANPGEDFYRFQRNGKMVYVERFPPSGPSELGWPEKC
jgi:hypothetical protein